MSSPSRRQSICAGQNQAGASHAATEGTARVGDGNKNMVAAEECRSAESQNIPTIENDDSPRTQRSQRTGTPCLTSRERRPMTEPPVTKATLSELDVTKIVNNPKLRHDINFDPELHFRPNIDGEKGKRKSQKANAFWDHMENQLGSYLTETEKFERENGDAEWALPATLRAIREILETLVPQRDRSSVEETFNIELLMQQFRNGVADMTKLSHWLSQLLKSHCAPMRDEWVDKMVVQFTHGDQNQDIRSSVEGMKTLLGILEAMKLDVANHQIRCLRPLLIDDTVHFEQKFFMKKIALRRVDVDEARAWYRRASTFEDNFTHNSFTSSQGNTWDFMKALVHLSLPRSHAEVVPHTFLFDEERIIKIRSDLQDLINIEVCMHIYQQLDASSRSQDPRLVLNGDSGATTPSSTDDEMDLPSPTIPDDHHFTSNHSLRPKPMTLASQKRWSANLDDDCASSSTASSPYSSPASLAAMPDSQPLTPLYLSNRLPSPTSQVRSSLLAILSSSSSSDKWKRMGPSLALQILRSTPAPLTHLPRFEVYVCAQISNPDSEIYQRTESHILSELLPSLRMLVDKYTPLTSLQIFEAATGPKAAPIFGIPSSSTSTKAEATDIATRLAHLGILHWRVWAPLAYIDEQQDEDMLPPVERARSMP